MPSSSAKCGLKAITSGFTGLMKVHGQLLNRHAGGIEGET
jgi:hypothetical protein